MSYHYKKDGSLDMRYSSSRDAVASGYSSSSYSGYSGGYSGYSDSSSRNYSSGFNNSSDLHYKKDGSLDLRFSSSKQAVSTVTRPSSGIHLKKDGTLDMRYNSSKEVANISNNVQKMNLQPKLSDKLHYKTDGSLDMGYKSSNGIPEHIPVTKIGIPDMRTKDAREWVKNQACTSTGQCPSWIPRTKDGSIDITKAITQEYLKWNNRITVDYHPNQRMEYYNRKLENELFRDLVRRARQEYVETTPQYTILPDSQKIQTYLSSSTMNSNIQDNDISSQIPNTIPMIDYKQLKIKTEDEIGHGSFGTVFKGTLNGKTVAIKKLHLQQLTRHEKNSFVKELKIMAYLGEHPTLVCLYGYTTDPPCIIMEYVELGSLSHLLHYNENQEIEAKMTDGRIKKKLTIEIVLGMIQLHTVNIVHGDLKPQNVLVSKDYTAKLTDFGLATLRGKTSSSIASTAIQDANTAVCGTAAYMAPELLSSSKPSELSSDAFSFGIMLNEVIQEEEPYSDQYRNFHGKGPYAAVLHAKSGNRPIINSRTPANLRSLIERCWSADPRMRPSFQQISTDLQSSTMAFPNPFQL
ncbi:unnamed protein product [Didymodactylos carnosus]|uniref:Protein kinase domain-containing protein n=1 Tax=Didymodactylos carnosus TaxID=1234261 RepID=A0A815T3F0_9BILA|nr:unnamed protein product [Didymodactylos carnosus]CAF1500175.1 unnamed protein product [Didymodactylos carnosus]CAF4215305.1 unnamed protein product [Didymodactylos carnosus]CAF4361960.1 unnamed protein product [Didymodactylos carnosus]